MYFFTLINVERATEVGLYFYFYPFVIYVILANVPPPEDVQIRPHALSVHSYKTPTFCDFCGEMLFGLVRQGLKCEGCGLNYHKRCVYKIPNNCNMRYNRRRSSSYLGVPRSPSESGSISSISALSDDSSVVSPTIVGGLMIGIKKGENSDLRKKSKARQATWLQQQIMGRVAVDLFVGRSTPWIEREMAGRIKIPHTFVVHSYTRPTVCHFCKKLLKGLFKQGLQCKDCKYNAHKKCIERIPKDCPGEAPRETGESGEGQESFEEKEASIGSRNSNEGMDDESDDSPSPPAGTSSPTQITNGKMNMQTTIFVEGESPEEPGKPRTAR
ncbi:Serine/threonine-protein kinase D3 [Orchesella cincta]|uniref:protein kinase C n=1 Tax=Orchesella cincta TaxID=48709 RepID=A0A1D2N108_ORCCI|nr:Serine/threonine-protein kinase D3 [Orchesella cincta]